jgi:hypothetical protein
MSVTRSRRCRLAVGVVRHPASTIKPRCTELSAFRAIHHAGTTDSAPDNIVKTEQ